MRIEFGAERSAGDTVTLIDVAMGTVFAAAWGEVIEAFGATNINHLTAYPMIYKGLESSNSICNDGFEYYEQATLVRITHGDGVVSSSVAW